MPPTDGDLHLEAGHQSRAESAGDGTGGITHHPDVVPLAAALATHYRSDWLIDVGCDRAGSMGAYGEDFFVAGLGRAEDVEACRLAAPLDVWSEVDLEGPGPLPLTDDQLRGAVLVCSGVLDRLADPGPLLAELARIRALAAAIVFSTSDCDRSRVRGDGAPPTGPAGVWNAETFTRLLTEAGLEPAFVGFTAADSESWRKDAVLAVVEGTGVPALERAPDAFRVVAVVSCYNEADILPFTIRRLLAQGIEVVCLDNWSTDGSFEVVQKEFGETVTAYRFPETDTKTFDWSDMLGRIEEIGFASGADWVILHDADEVREGPWPGVDLRDSLWNVQQRGFNAVNHQVVDFRPAEGEPEVAEGQDPAEAMLWWEHLTHPANVVQVKAWKNEGQRVELVETGGHDARFPGRRIFPYRFLLRHYSLRSPAHARRKIFVERVTRWNLEERAKGWHAHYDEASEGDSFLWAKRDLHHWSAPEFATEFLAERLTGTGVLRGDPDAAVRAVTNPPTAARVCWKRLRADRNNAWLEAATGWARIDELQVRAEEAEARALGSHEWAKSAAGRADAAQQRAAVAAREAKAAKAEAEAARRQIEAARAKTDAATARAEAAEKRAAKATARAAGLKEQIAVMKQSRRWRAGQALEQLPRTAKRIVKERLGR